MTLFSELRSVLAASRARKALLDRFPQAKVARDVDIRSPDRLHLGRDVMIDVGVVLHCGGMGWAPEGKIVLGDRCYVGPNAVLFGAGGIQVGNDALISPGVVITSHQHSFGDLELPIREQPLEFGPVTVEDDVWIGANAVILPGVRLGKGAVVGAGAVVTRDVAPGTLVVGVPARVIRAR